MEGGNIIERKRTIAWAAIFMYSVVSPDASAASSIYERAVGRGFEYRLPSIYDC